MTKQFKCISEKNRKLEKGKEKGKEKTNINTNVY